MNETLNKAGATDTPIKVSEIYSFNLILSWTNPRVAPHCGREIYALLIFVTKNAWLIVMLCQELIVTQIKLNDSSWLLNCLIFRCRKSNYFSCGVTTYHHFSKVDFLYLFDTSVYIKSQTNKLLSERKSYFDIFVSTVDLCQFFQSLFSV